MSQPKSRQKSNFNFATKQEQDKRSGKFGLNIELSDDDDFDNLMPPTRDQHEKKYGDTLVG